jgi:hypothetical protein
VSAEGPKMTRAERGMAQYERLADAVRRGDMTVEQAFAELGGTPVPNRPTPLGGRLEIRGEVDTAVNPGDWKTRGTNDA